MMMRAVVVRQFGAADVLKLETNYPIPTVDDKSSNLLIKVASAGVNPVETYIRAGAYTRLPSLPYIPGADGAGIVEKVGSKVEQFKASINGCLIGVYMQIGDRVFFSRSGSGSYAQYTACDQSSVWHLSSKLSFQQGAALGIPYFTAYRAIFMLGKARPGNRLLIHGASGAVGLAAVQLATAHGIDVFGTAGSHEGAELVTSNGAVKTFNHRDEHYIDQIKKSCDTGFDVIIEMLANVNLAADLELVAAGGRIVVVGCRGSIEISPRLLMPKESTIVGCALMNATADEWKEMGAAIAAATTNGSAVPIIDRTFALHDADKAHVHVIESVAGTRGKVVLDIAD